MKTPFNCTHSPCRATVQFRTLLCVMALLFINGCANNKAKPVHIKGAINATSVLNPDIAGKYRPVNIKVYYLKSDTPFSQASFTDLYQFTDKALGDSILHISTHQLLPGQTVKLEEEAPQGINYIGVVAAFRHIEDAHWKDIQPLPKKCVLCFGPGLWKPINISAERLSISLDVGNKVTVRPKDTTPQDTTTQNTIPKAPDNPISTLPELPPQTSQSGPPRLTHR